MTDPALISRLRIQIFESGEASASILEQIASELERAPSAELWILRGDAIQLSDGSAYSLNDAEISYFRALELDPLSAEAHESLGHFTFAVKDDAVASIKHFREAIALGAGPSAEQGLQAAETEIAESSSAARRALSHW